MSAPNGQQQISLTPQQCATMLLIEGLLTQMQTAANQLGGFLQYAPGADAVAHAHSVLGQDYARLRDAWQKSVVIASPAALSVIEGKAR